MIDMNKVRNSIANMRCKTHNKTPQNIKLVGKTVDFIPCCHEFGKQVNEKIAAEIVRQGKDEILKKSGFKK